MNKPKILFFDIETAGVNAFNADLGWVISVAYMWEDDKQPQCIIISDYPEFKKNPHDDTKLLQDFYKIIIEADFICGHYAERFDKKFINTRLKMAGLPGIPHIKLIDTWRLARTHLKLSSNRLANVAKALGCKNQKMAKINDFWPKGWFAFLKGDTKYANLMKKYNKQDVLAQREVALKLREFWPKWINYSSSQEIDRCCPRCGSERLQRRGFQLNACGKYQRYQCQSCSSYCRDKEAIFNGGMRG